MNLTVTATATATVTSYTAELATTTAMAIVLFSCMFGALVSYYLVNRSFDRPRIIGGRLELGSGIVPLAGVTAYVLLQPHNLQTGLATGLAMDTIFRFFSGEIVSRWPSGSTGRQMPGGPGYGSKSAIAASASVEQIKVIPDIMGENPNGSR